MTEPRPARHTVLIDREQFKFSAAHMTVFADGRKERLHGHNFQLAARLKVRSIALAELCDFGLLKDALREVCQLLNERVLVALHNPYLRVSVEESPAGGRVTLRHRDGEYILPQSDVALLPLDNITSEQLAVYCHGQLAERLRERLPEAVLATLKLLIVTVYERPGQGGEYRAPISE